MTNFPFQVSTTDKNRLIAWQNKYQSMMFDDVIPFWTRLCPDNKFGGYLNYIDRKGNIFSGIKSVWILGRGVWLFAHLYNTHKPEPQWLDLAKLGVDFIDKYCFDTDGTAFLATTRDGKPINKGLGFFSEAFIMMGYAELATAMNDKARYEQAKNLFAQILKIYDTPAVIEPVMIYPAFHQMKAQAAPMIMLSTAQVLRDAANSFKLDDDIKWLDKLCARFVTEIGIFYKPELGCLIEGLKPDTNEFIDEPDGRITCPGHSCESAWFIMDEARHQNNEQWNQLAVSIVKGAMNFGWDKECGGMLTFVDCKHLPTDSLEHDIKIWWPHNEALVATLAAWRATGDSQWLDWHEKIFDWTMSKFPDHEYGEWYGYLRRDGAVSNDVKGNMWKGLFHIPRALYKAASLIEDTLK